MSELDEKLDYTLRNNNMVGGADFTPPDAIYPKLMAEIKQAFVDAGWMPSVHPEYGPIKSTTFRRDGKEYKFMTGQEWYDIFSQYYLGVPGIDALPALEAARKAAGLE